MKTGGDVPSQGGRTALASSASLLSATLFGFGLVAPLTPSYGCPTVGDVVVFAGLPALMAAGGAASARGFPRGALVIQTLLVAGAAMWVLVQIGCGP